MKRFLLAAALAAAVSVGVATATASADSTTAATQASASYAGTGNSTLGPITVTDTTVLYWRSDGTSFHMYNVDRSNPNGEVGPTADGSGATILPAGTYTLDIATGGDWSITAVGSIATATTASSATEASPVSAATAPSPTALSGSGNGVVGPVTFPTTTVLYWRSDGTSFSMYNVDRSNPNGEVGSTRDGSGATIVPAGTYTLDIATDGDWSITVDPQ